MISSDRPNILAARTERRFKKHRFSLLKSLQDTGFCRKTLPKHIRIVKYKLCIAVFTRVSACNAHLILGSQRGGRLFKGGD